MLEGPTSRAGGADAGLVDALADPGAGARAASGGIVRIGLQVVSLALALFSTAVITRHLGTDGFGQYATVLALATLISGVTDFGLANVGVSAWLHLEPAQRQGLMSDLLTARLLIAGAAAACAIVYSFVAGYSEPVVIGAVVAMVGVTINALMSVLTVPLMADLRWAAIGGIEVASTFAQVAIQVPLVLAGAGVVPLVAATTPAAVVSLSIAAYLTRAHLVAPSAHVRGALGILRESVAFGAASATSVVYLRSTMLVVPLAVSATAAGHFAVGFRAIESLTIVPLLLTGALFPVLVHASINDRERLRTGFDALWRSSATIGGLAAGCVVGIAPLAVLAISGGSNATSEHALVVLSVGLAALFMSAPSMWLLLAEKAYRDVLRINAVALPLNLTLTAAAAVAFGAEWAGVGLLVCELFLSLAANRLVCRQLGVRGLGHVGHGARVMLGVVAAAALFVVLEDAPGLVRLIVPPLTCATILVTLRCVPSELRAMVLSRLSELRRPKAPAGA